MRTIEKRVFNGSWGIVVLWAILCWPIAVIYYFLKTSKETFKVK